jgi:tRNA pseudouridine55 synthase
LNTGQIPGDGLLLLDKPVGISSFQALYPVKRIFRGRKIGHAGTLDPAASGLLVVGVGAGTRLLEFLEGLPKCYRFAARLGVVTDTFDLEGKILEQRDAGDITREQVEAALLKFRGEITQLPPVYSAIKIQGKRACDRVRAGETVTLNPRQIRIYRLQVTAFEKGVVTLEMDCSKGTYVRTIAHDIGRELGCGAAADAIRRLSVGPFQVGDAIAPDAVTGSENLIPVEKGVDHLPAIKLRSDSWVEALLHGNPVPAAGYTAMPPASLSSLPGASTDSAGSATGDTCGIFSPTGKLLAIGTVTALGQVQPRKVLQVTK